jgi:predicted lipoprotein
MQRLGKRRILGAVVLVALLVAMALNTKFVTPKELASIGPESFDAKTTAASLFKKARTEFEAKAAPLPEVVTAIQTDPKAAGEKYQAASPSEGTRIFAVTATGTVTDATRDALTLKVPGVPADTQVLVPLTTAINGTVLRDALGFKFADAPGQSDYQFVGDELKKLMQAEVKKGLGGDPAATKGKQITVLGVISVVGDEPQPKAKPINIQPVSVEVGS